jgi:SAM-dependent methyltransferase
MAVVANGVRLRRRLTSLAVVHDSAGVDGEGFDDDGHVVVHTHGLEVGDGTRRAAVRHLRDRGLEAVDLVPGDLPVEELLDHLRISDPARLRTNPIFVGFGAGQAVVMTRDLAERGGVAPGAVDTVDVRRAFAQAKRFAPHDVDQVVVPGLASVPLAVSQNLAVWRTQYGRPLPMIAATRLGPAAAAAVLGARRSVHALWLAAAAAIQPTLVIAGTAVRPRDRARLATGAGRLVAAPLRLARSARGGWRPAHPAHTDPRFIDDERRARYADDLARGVERFVGPERDDCPVCAGTDIAPRLVAPDMIQCKPGTFRVDTCRACGTSFQNPQLTAEGLDFYYRDFYDGSGSADTEMMFSADWPLYRRRARLLDGFTATPRRWLDVGGGHGHFCLVAAGEHPGTRFELLDQPSAVDEAVRRGWVADGHGDMFPKAAGDLAGAFDVVSMFHYLEHTTDPLAELDAAHRVLEPGGHLIVEVPAPDCRPASWYGWAWGPWMQPQHLNLLPLDTMVDQLERRGFDVVHTDRRRPRQPWDTSWAAFQVLTRLAPGPNAPWTEPRSRAHRAARMAGLAAGAPLMVAAMLADRLVIDPLIRIDPRLSNVYWLVARKRDEVPTLY